MAAGTKVGTGYVDIEPDFSGFQEKVGRKLNESLAPHFRKIGKRGGSEVAKGFDSANLKAAFTPLLRRFERFGDDAGKSIADKVGKGSKRASGDMFGLAGAVAEVERRNRSAGKTASVFAKDMFGINRAAKGAGRDLRSVSTQLSDFHTKARQAKGVSRSFMAGIKGLASDFRKVGRAILPAAGGFGNFEGVMARANRGFQFFRNILRTIRLPAIVAGIGLFIQALSALTAGIVATTSAIGPLVGALVAIPAGALAAAQALGVLKLATAGVADAVKAGLDLEVKGGEQAIDVMDQQRAAAESVADSKRNLTGVQRQALYAQEDLTKARKEATRQLEDMRLAAEGSHDSEQQAALGLRQAEQELAKTLRDPGSSGLDVRFAEEAVDQARRQVEETRIEAKRTREDYRDAQRKGVEGMPEVVAAKRAEADANRAVQDAERDLAKATRESTKAMQEQGSSATAFQQKLQALPPAAQTFVRFLLKLKPRLDELRDTAAAGFFPGATKGIKSLMANFGVIRKGIGGTAEVLGNFAAKAGKVFGSKAWGKDLSRLGKLNQRILGRMGDSALNLADAFRNILVAAEPFLDWLSESSNGLTSWIKDEAEAGRKSGALAEFFAETRHTMELLKPILTGVGGALLNIGKAARPLGNEILGALGGAAQGWKGWTDSTKGQNELRKYFSDSKPAIFETGRLLRDAVKAFLELGHQKGVVELLHLVRTKLLPALTDITGAVTGWAGGFLKEFGRLREDGVPTFDAFLRTLANHAGKAAVKIAKAVWDGFWGASFWGKAAIATFLFKKIGGFKVIGELGAKMGAKYGKRFLEKAAKWIAGTSAGEGLGGWLGRSSSEGGEIGKASSQAGSRAGRLLGRGIVIGAVAGIALLGGEIAAAIREYIRKPVQKAYEDAFGGKIGGAINDATNFIGKNYPETLPGGSVVKGIFGGDGGGDKIVGEVAKTRKGVIREYEAWRKGAKSHFDALPGIAERSSKGVVKQTLPRIENLARQAPQKSDVLAEGVGGSFASLSGKAKAALENLEQNVRSSLRGLKAGKLPTFNLKTLSSASAYHHAREKMSGLGRQRGGFVPKELATGGLAATVPGTSTGDRHTLSLNGVPVAKVESREGIFVGNRNMMAAAEAMNDRFPRFQKGGLLAGPIQKLRRGGLAEPKLEGDAGPLRELGRAAIHKVYEGAKDLLGKQGPMGAPTGTGGPVPAGTVRDWLTEALKITGHFSPANLSALYGRAIQESGGNPKAINLWDSNAEAGHPSKGLLQTIDSTFNSYKMKGHGDIWDPIDNAIAAIRYMFARYGHIVGPSSTDYMRGGLLKLAAGGMPQLGPMSRKGGQPFDAEIMKGFATAGPSLLRDAGEGFPPKTIGRVKSKAQQIASAFTGYVWGGGHGEGTSVLANGLDCSGSIAKLMQQAGWTDFAVGTSGEYMSRLMAGAGDLFTIWSNPDHTFAEIEGKMWGTNTANGLGYHTHTTAGFTPRHPKLAADASPATGTSAVAPPEKVPDVYKRAKTGDLNLGSIPKNLKGVEAQIKHWQEKTPVYRAAKADAEKKGKPATAEAIGRNLEKIEQRLVGLRNARLRLRLAEVKKKLADRIKPGLGKFAGYEQQIAGQERDFNIGQQLAEQIVEQEPQLPEFPDSWTDKQREEAEKTHVANYTGYVEGREKPVFEGLLGKAANWRNTILRAEIFGFGKGQPSVQGLSGRWENEAFNARSRIEQIKDFTAEVAKKVAAFRREHPKAKGKLPDWLDALVGTRDRMREQLPALRLKDTQLTEAISEARGYFYPGGPNRIDPPDRPLEGSGSFEDSLQTVQGIHWPDHHELIDGLPATRTPGRFGGVIWDLQGTIEGLGLKIREAAAGIKTAEPEKPDESERLSLLEELLRQSNQEKLVREIERKVFGERKSFLQLGGLVNPDLLPKFHGGGIVRPGPFGGSETPVMALAGERIRTPEQELEMAEAIRAIGAGGGGSGEPHVEVNINERTGEVEVKVNDQQIEAVVNRMQQRGARSAGRRRAVVPNR